MYKSWSKDEEDFIRDNAGRLTDEELVEIIEEIFNVRRKFASVRKKRQRMGIKKANGRGVCQVT